MAKIKVTSKCAIYDGMIMTFKSPCDCTVADGINVYFRNEKKTFLFRDAHGNDVSKIDDLFTIDTYVTVSLDTTNGYAYLQNADTNAYLEEALAGKSDSTHGHALTDSTITGTLPVSKGGTGATSNDEYMKSLFAAGTSVTTYPKKPGIYRTVGTNIFSNLPYTMSHYGVLVIFAANEYSLHIYIDNYGDTLFGRGTIDSSGNVVEPTATKWKGSNRLTDYHYGASLPAAGTKGRLFFKQVSS